MTEVNVLKCPSKTILYCSGFDKTILVLVISCGMIDWGLLARSLVMIFIEELRREMGLKSCTLEAPSILSMRVI